MRRGEEMWEAEREEEKRHGFKNIHNVMECMDQEQNTS